MSDATVRISSCEISEEMAGIIAALAEHDQDRAHLRQQLATVRTLLKAADADLAAERKRFPVCRCCGDPIPSKELIEVMERAMPIHYLTATAPGLWERGFCSERCETDYAAAGPSEPGRCSKCGLNPPERDGLCRECYNGMSADEAEARADAERDCP